MSAMDDALRRRKLPWGLIGMIPLVLAVEAYVSRHEPDLMNDPLILSWQIGRQSATREAKPAEILCMGDSLVRLGLLPKVLEQKLGKSAYNLASPGAPSSANYFLLRHALESGARPKALIVDFHSNVLTNPPRATAHFWAEILSLGEAFELCLNARDHRLFLSTAVSLALPSYRRREGIREEVVADLKGEVRASREVIAANRRNIRVNQGASPHAKRTAIPDDPAPSMVMLHWKPYAVNATYVTKFLDLAASHHIPVFWLLPPLSPARQERLERRGVDTGYTHFVESTVRRYKNIVVIDGRHAGYTTDVFVDATHLDKQGAAELTSAVASILKERLEHPDLQPRLVNLPPFRGQPGDFLLEDLEESRTAVRTQVDKILR